MTDVYKISERPGECVWNYKSFAHKDTGLVVGAERCDNPVTSVLMDGDTAYGICAIHAVLMLKAGIGNEEPS